MKKISGNKLLVKALREEQVDTIFGYPGACTIDISDELYKQDYTKVILPRQEVALVHEADAYARSTGKTGVCLVTSGPGATNLVTGLATAYYDSVPLVCFTGQVSRHLIVPGSRYYRNHQKHYEIWCYGQKQGRPRTYPERSILYCKNRKAGTGIDRPSKRCNGRIRKCRVSG